jgi:ABC-type sugar transport system ATPase subunit
MMGTLSDPVGAGSTRFSDAASVLSVRGVSKHFGGTRALKSVDLDVAPGEIVGLVGENGAGKSTLVNILTGVVQPDSGEIIVGGAVTRLASPTASRAAGIATVFQELALAPHLSAAENLFLGRLGSLWSTFDSGTVERRATAALGDLGWEIDPRSRIGALLTSDQQLVEIARAIESRARVLLLDEPTSSLAPREADELGRKIRELSRAGIAVIYVSHHLSEVFDLVDSFAVLRDGQMVLRCAKRSTDRQSVVRAMLGEASTPFDSAVRKDSEARWLSRTAEAVPFDLRRATQEHRFQDVTLQVLSGEVLGLTGLRGCGAEEVATSLFVQRNLVGEIRCFGRQGPLSPSRLIKMGVGYVPPERRTMGLYPDLSVRENLNLTARVAGKHIGPTAVEEVIYRLSIRTPDADVPVRELSGGNQQKVLIARWLLLQPRALILVEPTRGVDIGVRHEIHRLLRQFASEGLAVVVASLDLEEVSEICDRILIMHEGRVRVELQGPTGQQELHDAIAEEASA